MRKGKKIFLPAAVAASVVLLVSGTLTLRSVFGGMRFDFTEEKLYTLSDGTKKMLENLKEPINVRFFYSAKLVSGIPVLQSYAERLKALLDTYQRLSDGKFRVQIISPEPFSQEEDDAVAFGVQPVPVDQNGTQLYFGLSMNNSTDDNKVFSFMNPDREQFLEYDLTRAVYELSQEKKTKVALVSGVRLDEAPAAGIPGAMGGASEWSFLQYLKEEFDVVNVDEKDSALPKDVGVVMLVRPHVLEEGMIGALKQFVGAGGKVLVFADPMAESEGVEGGDAATQKLLKEWGVDYDSGLVALDAEHAARSSVSQDSEGKVRSLMLDKPNWIIAGESMIARDHPAVSNLRQIVFKSPGRLVYQGTAGSKLEWKPLILTGNSSMEVKSEAVSDPEALLRNYKPSGDPMVLAAQLTGVFPGGKAQGTVIAVADVDMLNDSAWLDKQDFMGSEMHMQLADNGAFVLNALDYLAGSDVLSSLRGRSQVQRPFEAVNALRREAERAFLDKQQELQKKLDDTQSKLSGLRDKAKGREAVVSPEEQKEMDEFTKRLLETRVELRKVQHSLSKDIESLGGVLKLLLIGIFPVLVALLGFVLPGRLGVKRGKSV